MRLPDFMKPLVVRAVHLAALMTRAATLGVRVAVFDKEGRILLVKHTYVPGWYFPGGAVDRGETVKGAAIRELKEEAGIIAADPPDFFGFYHNARQSSRDHIALFTLTIDQVPTDALQPNAEIAEAGFFSAHDLPLDTTDATRRRLEEIRTATISSDIW